ncbi:MAG: transglycosylase SLT domain-containing protein [Pseudomonadota bacterium]
MPREQDFEGLRAPGEPEKSGLLPALAQYLDAWARALASDVRPSPARVQELNQRVLELQQRSVSAGFGGLAHHLGAYMHLLETGADPRSLRAQLGIISELAADVRARLAPAQNTLLSASGGAARPDGGGAGAGGVAPPPLITVMRPASPGLAEFVQNAAPPGLVSGFNGFQPRPEAPAGSVGAAPQVPVPPVHGPAPAVAPQFGVKNMLGLRAFNKGRRAEAAQPPLPEAKAAPKGGGLLALAPLAGTPAPGPVRPSSPPRLDRSDHMSLPPLSGNDAVRHARSARESGPFEQRAAPAVRASVGASAQHRAVARRSNPPRPLRGRPEKRSVGLWVGGASACILLGSALLAFFVFVRRPARHSAELSVNGAASAVPSEASSASAAKPSGGAAPRERLLADDERFLSLLAQVHGHGGTESPELRSLLNEQAALASKALSGKCNDGSFRCKAWSDVRGLIVGDRTPALARRRRGSDTEATRSRWMTGLKMPGVPVEDDPRVLRVFEFYTENPVGRETFQSMLFRCGAYRDLIQSTLIRYDLPPELLALVFTESGCEPSAKSPVGAAGLWQFMPETGRAYHLNIVEGAIDERLNPFKSTEAGIRMLADLRLKLGSWDLVFASYNLGPFGVLARLEKAGADASFWDLVDADLLPDETANYAPTVDAIALILANLQRLKFAGVQIRAPQMTADLEVPGGTRLSLVARAAATSVTQLHALNLDFSGDVVPVIPGGAIAVQVPKDVVWQARDTLKELLASKDGADQCVPPSFDWGKQRFTPEMNEACQRRLSAVSRQSP